MSILKNYPYTLRAIGFLLVVLPLLCVTIGLWADLAIRLYQRTQCTTQPPPPQVVTIYYDGYPLPENANVVYVIPENANVIYVDREKNIVLTRDNTP